MAISHDVLKRYHDLNAQGRPFEAVKEFQTAFAAVYELGYRVGKIEAGLVPGYSIELNTSTNYHEQARNHTCKAYTKLVQNDATEE